MMTQANATPEEPHSAPASTSDTQCTSASNLPLCVIIPPPIVSASAAFGFAAAWSAPCTAERVPLAGVEGCCELESLGWEREALHEASAGTMTKKRKARVKYAEVEWPEGKEKLWWRSSEGLARWKNFLTADVAEASLPKPTPPTAMHVSACLGPVVQPLSVAGALRRARRATGKARGRMHACHKPHK